jgi:hypothetical protein
MPTAELAFETQVFDIARRSLAATFELFVKNSKPLEKPLELRSRALLMYRAFHSSITSRPLTGIREN